MYTTHMAVEYYDVLSVSSQPRVEVPAQIHQLLQVWHSFMRPRKVSNLHSQFVKHTMSQYGVSLYMKKLVIRNSPQKTM